MSAENLSGEGSAAAAEVRTGPRHAAPKKPLFNRFHMPAGKAIAMAAMPTAVLMGIGFTPTLALADDAPTAKSLTADEYKDCIAALDGSASPSASASSSPDSDDATATPSPSASSGSNSGSGSGGSSSSDSGSDDKATPTPTPSASASKEESSSSDSSGSGTATPSPSPSASDDGNLLTDIGDALTGIFTGGSGSSDPATATPTPTPSASASKSADDSAGDTAKDTADKVTDTVKDAVKDTSDTASKAAEDTTKAVQDTAKAAEEAAADATASPSPSASSTTDPEDCPVATDEVGDTEPGITVADNAWTLKASSLTLKGADYQGVVKVKTASGKTKKVLKYVVSGGTDIGDLHQIVTERGKTYHVQAGKGTTSKITDGKTTMYTESISGNLLGLIPITFSPDNPPPLNIPLIYFTNVTVQQAAQYGGTLTVPGMHQYSEG
ncbi:flagellar hook-basal body complex protein FliE [Streptomyces sp. SAI-135]|uniref:hypothetical protein n=1 Tax=unclassified Streptomyces TaxID=2593676 RepID=UPI0024751366|nr:MULTISPECIES: hypothetical protein [unclassified Streptomyces]MDH6516427.1 flagellar hook-basal body complex protein FliE [Streptomyces sp. SAI-090]MDH6619484.1 flagellar hook-basal body complex protein FliE [Streptomyces sp. SAI-135]